ncbi:6159_t:CDS:2, partial [Ambispora leptoticha]
MIVTAIGIFICSRPIFCPSNTTTRFADWVNIIVKEIPSNKPIKSAEGVVAYLTKYLAKSFSMRANLEQAEKSGLLSGMKIYKFFQTSYGDHK